MTLKMSGSFKIPAGSFKAGDVPPPPPTFVPTTWNPADNNGFALSNGNLTAQAPSGKGAVHTIAAVSTGKWYWEITFGGTYFEEPVIGIVDSATVPNTEIYGGDDKITFKTDSTGRRNVNGTLDSGGMGIQGFPTAGTVYGLAFDADAGKLWIHKNGTWAYGASTANVEAGTNPFGTINSSSYQAIIADDKSIAVTFIVTANFGQNAFSYTVPSGFEAGFGTLA
jgi:hypothetical protein